MLKGPTDAFLAWAGHPLTSDGIAAHYAGLLDGLVADERADAVPTLVTDVEMGDAAGAPPASPARCSIPARSPVRLRACAPSPSSR